MIDPTTGQPGEISPSGNSRGENSRGENSGEISREEITGDERVTLRALYERARSYADTDLGPKLERAYDYFNGKVDAPPAFQVTFNEQGDEVYHGSKAVVRECRDKLRAAMPELARVFLSSDELVAFTPNSKEDVEYAQQATDYCNFTARSEGGEERILDAFFDWLMKFAAIKVYWSVETRYEVKGFDGVNEIGLQHLQQRAQSEEDTLEGFEAEPYQKVLEAPGPDGQMQQEEVTLYKGKTRECHRKRGIKWELFPQDEFIIDPDALTERNALMIGQDCYRTVSDVVAMGIPYEVVKRHASSLRPGDSDRVVQARRGRSVSLTATDVPDESLAYVRYIEVIVRLDRDGDGIAERYRAVMLGDGPEPIALEPGDDCYFLVASPYRQPHMPIGTGLVEDGVDIQDQITALVRGWLNSLNRSNHPREVCANGDNTAYASLLSPFGGPVRADNPQSVGIHAIPFVGDRNLPLIQYFEARSASRFGISQAGAGLDADVLKGQTAEGTHAIVAAPQVVFEFLAREFAAGIMAPMFKATLAISKRYQDKATVIRLRGQWIEVDPTAWPEDMDVGVKVGLGGGTRGEKLAGLGAIMLKQEQHMQLGSPLVSMREMSNALQTFCELQGYKDSARFFKELTDEELQQMQQQQQEAQKQQAMEAAQMAAQAEAFKAAAVEHEKSAAAIEKVKIDAELERAKLESGANIAREGIAMDMAAARDKIASEHRTAQERIASEERLARERLAMERDVKFRELEMELEIEKMKMQNRSPGGQGNVPEVASIQ